MTLFSKLVKSIQEFHPSEPMVTEAILEKSLKQHLESNGFTVNSQVTKRHDRYDLLCREDNKLVCIEIKLRTDISDIKQFDKYLPKFKDGFIVVCWQSSPSLKEIFCNVIDQCPTPVTIIELSEGYSLV